MYLLVSTSDGFWPLLLDDTKRHERDMICSWKFVLSLVDFTSRSLSTMAFNIELRWRWLFSGSKQIHESKGLLMFTIPKKVQFTCSPLVSLKEICSSHTSISYLPRGLRVTSDGSDIVVQWNQAQ